MYAADATSSCFLSTASDVCTFLLASIQYIVRSYKHIEYAVMEQEGTKQCDAATTVS